MSDYLDAISVLGDDEREQLRSIGAPTAFALYSAMEASPEPFMRLLASSERYDDVMRALDELIPEKDKRRIESVKPTNFTLGVAVGNESPTEIRRTALIEERDRVYDEIQRIENSHDRSIDARRRVEQLRSRLDEILREQAA